MPIYGYCRASQGDSLTQRQMLIDAGVPDHLIFADDGVSGIIPPEQRPAYAQLRQRIAPGDRLIIRELARLSRRKNAQVVTLRDLRDLGADVQSLHPAEQQMLNLLSASADPLSQAMGEAVLIVLAALGEVEYEQIRTRSMAGQARAKAAGKTIGRPELSQHQKDMVRRMHSEGTSKMQIAKRLDISRSTVQKYLRNAPT